MKPLVSIITACYNAERFISSTIESILEQTFTNWELLIIDDCSTDKSRDVVNQFTMKDNRIKLLLMDSNGGSAKARNKGLENAQGRYITFLDSDDMYYPTYCQNQLNYIKDKKASLIYASYDFMDEEGNKILKPFLVSGKVDYYKLLYKNVIGSLTGFFDTEKVGRVFFNSDLKTREDFHFWLSILKKIDFAYANSEVLACYRLVSNSKTSNKKELVLRQFMFYLKMEKAGLFRSLIYTITWAINGLKKYS